MNEQEKISCWFKENLDSLHVKVDLILINSISNKSKLKFHDLQLYALWFIIFSTTSAALTFLIYKG